MANEKYLSNSVIFLQGEKVPKIVAKYFIGDNYYHILAPSPNSPFKCGIANVTFEPGCRNNWHAHPSGQILLVTGGRGWYQEEGKLAQELLPGDVVEILPKVKHWHGAAADSWFVHLAIDPDTTVGPLEWFEPIIDEEYKKLKSCRNYDK